MNNHNNKIALILAAGKGKRMNSELPKVLHEIRGRYVVDYVIDSAHLAGLDNQILVIGFQADRVRESLQGRKVQFVLQEKQLGTGHAVMMAEKALDSFDGDLVVLCGDMPLVKPKTIQGLIRERHRLNAAAVVLTVVTEKPESYGRIVRDSNGMLEAIVEFRDASEEIQQIKEINTGAYCFDWKKLRPILSKLSDNNDQGEFYLTDSISILVRENEKVGALRASDSAEGLGVTSTDDLAKIEKILDGGTS